MVDNVGRDDAGDGGVPDVPNTAPPADEVRSEVKRDAADEMEGQREIPHVDPDPNEMEAAQDPPAAPEAGENGQIPEDPNGGNEHEKGYLQKLRTPATILIAAAVGAVAAPVIVTGAFYAIGLSSVGPIAGGWFAANMGSGLVAGSAMATLQSAAMSAGTYTAASLAGLGVGAATGGVTASQEKEKKAKLP